MPASFALPEPDVQLFMPWGLSGGEPRDQHYVVVAPQAQERPREAQELRGWRRPGP
jgi:hypothetical protein